ncbi:MAG: chorismate lyase [Magnetococcales bacterium]|nr:chorismate lyase [Magnetococcales bacterium]HIJ85217.1 chorismate lyase [Magnetococcales bacterium]
MDSKQRTPSFFSGIQFIDPWSEPDQLLAAWGENLSPSLRELLTWRGSLTQRLEDIIGERVELQLINHENQSSWPQNTPFWTQPDANELGVDILIRDAWLVLDGNRYVFAHSEIVLNDLPVSDRQAIMAGDQALGYFFMEKNGRLKREWLQLRRIFTQNSSNFLKFGGTAPCWCRRSMFHVNERLRARIVEIFPSVLPFSSPVP